MSTPQEVSNDSPAMEVDVYSPSRLELIRQRMTQGHAQHDWYLAGELETHPFYPYDFDRRGEDTGIYDFYVAPPEPQFETTKLNNFTDMLLSYFSKFVVKTFSNAEGWRDGSMQLPWMRLAEKKVGERTIKTTVTITNFTGSKAVEEPKVEETSRALPITETTNVRVFSDLTSAQVLFDYARMVRNGTLSEKSDGFGIQSVHTSHHLEDYQLAALKRCYHSGKATPTKVKKALEKPTT